jgi:hypothetical protein
MLNSTLGTVGYVEANAVVRKRVTYVRYVRHGLRSNASNKIPFYAFHCCGNIVCLHNKYKIFVAKILRVLGALLHVRATIENRYSRHNTLKPTWQDFVGLKF